MLHFADLWRQLRPAGPIALGFLVAGVALGAAPTRLVAPFHEDGAACHGAAKPMARLELLFGTSRPQGSPITEEEWTSFLDTVVTPRFPEGLTVLSGPGQWRGEGGQVTKERAFVVVIWYPPSRLANAHIEAIRSAYKQRFAQESVMRVDSTACVSF